MHRQTLELSRKVLGPEHPDTLKSMSELGSVLSSQGKYVEAEQMHRQYPFMSTAFDSLEI